MTDQIASQEFTFDSDGLAIFGRVWRPARAPRAIVAICHGLNSHSGHYIWPAEQMVAAGFAVYALDLRGRGRSEGERFHVESIEDYVSDLDGLIDLALSREGAVPVYLLGHSAGGVTSCVYTLEHQEKLAGLICESFAFQVPAPDFALSVIKGISHVVPHLHVLTLKNEDFSRDPEVVARLNADPLIAQESQPTQTVAALVRADERLERDFPSITLPVLIIHGTADKATKPSGSQFFYDNAGSTDKSLTFYEGHFHDLLSDVGRGQVLLDIIDWMNDRV
ncbi:MAG: lysophospholipase [Sphingobium sp.]